MKQTTYSVRDRRINWVDVTNITGVENVDKFHFEFDSEWDEFEGKFFVLIVDGTSYINQLDENNDVILRNIVYEKQNVTFGVYGIDTENGAKLASNIVAIETTPSIWGQIRDISDLPSKTQWEVYTEEMLGLLAEGDITLEQCQQALSDTQSARDLTQGYKETTEGYKNTTKGYMDTTEGYKNDTAGLKQDVVNIVNAFDGHASQKTTDFNNNATQKTNAFNSNATSKTGDFNDNASAKTTAFNENYTEKVGIIDGKTSDFSDYATQKTNDFNTNASNKTTAFNNNASDKTDAFNSNATSKTSDFNSNATSKTGDFNTNATNKTNSFNSNASDKTTDFNNNYDAKIAAFDDHVSGYAAQIDNLEEVVGNDTDTFSTSSTYAIGDVVVHDNKFYRCKTAITTAGAWDSSKWDEINVRQELDEKETRIEELEEHLALVESNYDTDTAIGSDLNIEDSLNGYNQGIAVAGNTTQETTTGKNLLNTSGMSTGTSYGVTVTRENDGTIKLSGTATQDYYIFIFNTQPTYPAGTYLLSGCVGGSSSTYRLAVMDSAYVSNLAVNYSGENSFTLSEDTEVSPLILVKSGINVNGVTFKPMIRLASITDDTYEPYTGGPTPRPDYPQPLVDATGTQEIETSNKNLLIGDYSQFNNVRWNRNNLCLF